MLALPPKPIVVTTFKTTLLVWVVLRGLLVSGTGTLAILPPASLFLMMSVAVTAVMDIVVARERVFLGNLGVGRRGIAGMSFVLTGVLEVISGLVLLWVSPGG